MQSFFPSFLPSFLPFCCVLVLSYWKSIIASHVLFTFTFYGYIPGTVCSFGFSFSSSYCLPQKREPFYSFLTLVTGLPKSCMVAGMPQTNEIMDRLKDWQTDCQTDRQLGRQLVNTQYDTAFQIPSSRRALSSWASWLSSSQGNESSKKHDVASQEKKFLLACC